MSSEQCFTKTYFLVKRSEESKRRTDLLKKIAVNKL